MHTSFEYSNFHFILYGMLFRSGVERNRAAHPRMEEARPALRRVQQGAIRWVKNLPGHRALLEQVYVDGFQSGAGRVGPAPSFQEAPVAQELRVGIGMNNR